MITDIDELSPYGSDFPIPETHLMFNGSYVSHGERVGSMENDLAPQGIAMGILVADDLQDDRIRAGIDIEWFDRLYFKIGKTIRGKHEFIYGRFDGGSELNYFEWRGRSAVMHVIVNANITNGDGIMKHSIQCKIYYIS